MSEELPILNKVNSEFDREDKKHVMEMIQLCENLCQDAYRIADRFGKEVDLLQYKVEILEMERDLRQFHRREEELNKHTFSKVNSNKLHDHQLSKYRKR